VCPHINGCLVFIERAKMKVSMDAKHIKYTLIFGLLLFFFFPGLFFFILGLSLFVVLVPITLGIIGFWAYFWQMRRHLKMMQGRHASGEQKNQRIMKDIN